MTKISVKRPITTIMVILVVCLFGILGYSSLELAYMPSIDLPIAVVRTTYTGAGPEEIEELITKPIEETVATLTGVDTITSISSVGSSLVAVQYVDGTDLSDAAIDLREKIDLIKSTLPTDANDPMVLKLDMNAQNLTVGVTSDALDTNALHDFLEQNVTKRLERLDGVSSVDIAGGQENEVQIIVDPKKMDGYGITIAQIRQTLGAENANIPAGTVTYGDSDMQLRAVGEFKSTDEIKNIVISTGSGNYVRLSDVAEVTLVQKDKDSLSLINGREGIIYSISKNSDANIVTVSDAVIAELESLSAVYPDLHLELLTDTSEYIKASINNIVETAFLSAIIAVFVLLFFLGDPKSSLVIGVSIPTSIVATFALMYLKGMTMNTISMGGIVIGIGMLVDNSVVVLENINTHFNRGLSAKEAAIEGTKEVSMAIAASTLTTIACFAPLIFVSGIIGQLLQDLAFTICFALVSSLVVALTFVPMACSKLLKREDEKNKTSWFSKFQKSWLGVLDKIDNAYQKLLKLCLGHKKGTVIVVIMCFVASLALIPLTGIELIPQTDEGTITVSIDMPSGAKYEVVEEMTYLVIEQLGEIPEAEMVYTEISSNSLLGGAPSTITLNLVDKQERDRSTNDVIRDIKQRLSDIAGAEIDVEASGSAMGSLSSSYDLALNVTGEDLDTLAIISNELIESFSTIPGSEEFTSSLEESIPEGNIVLNREKAARYGISTYDIASAVNTAVAGSVASQYKVGGTEIDIRIKYDKNQTAYLKDLNNLTIRTAQGTSIPITEVAEISVGDSAVSINRENQQRYVTINGNFIDTMDDGTIQNLVQEKLDEYSFPQDYSYSFGGNMEMMNESFSALGIALVVAVLLIYMIMAAQFESLLHPFIIMFSMPLAITGGILGLFLTGNSISAMAFMGFIMLIGMVVNNGIVLVDYANQVKERNNIGSDEAMLIAGPSRLRPILMTTLTTILGLLPMAVSTASGMETQQPLAITVMFGLAISTVVTLVFIPALYSVVDKLRAKSPSKKSGEVADIEKYQQPVNQY